MTQSEEEASEEEEEEEVLIREITIEATAPVPHDTERGGGGRGTTIDLSFPEMPTYNFVCILMRIPYLFESGPYEIYFLMADIGSQ